MPPIPSRVNRLPETATQAQSQQRMRRTHRVQTIGREQRGRNGEQPQDLASAQAGFAEYLEDVGQQGNTRAEQHQADDVERIVARFAVIRQMPVDHIKAA